jgi:hypothetical protein
MKSFIKMALAVSAIASVGSSANAYDYSTYSAMMTTTAPTTVTTTYPSPTTYPIPTVDPTPVTTCASPTIDFDMEEFEVEYGTDGTCMTMKKGPPKKKECRGHDAGPPPVIHDYGRITKTACKTACGTNACTWGGNPI